MTTEQQTSAGIVLSGLDGSNPLAFLAALGTLRTLSLAWPDQNVRMAWVRAITGWVPTLHSLPQASGENELLEMLKPMLYMKFAEHPLSILKDKTELDTRFTRYKLGITAEDREAESDWLSALCSDTAPDATCQIQTARRDYFAGNLENIVNKTNSSHLRRALFQTWDYADSLANQSLHMDPTEDRRHAYQWSAPTCDGERDKKGGMLGANRLAIESFPYFQSNTVGSNLSTRGFTGLEKNNIRWTWPIWICPLGYNETGSLLSLPELQAEKPNASRLHACGVATAFRCWRILVERTPNFTPATAFF